MKWSQVIGCALAFAMSATSASAHVQAQQAVVDLRGTAGSVSGAIVRSNGAGLVVRVLRNGIDREETIPWSEVRAVDAGDGTEFSAADAAWLKAGEALWRGRARALRGDWGLALQPLERAAEAWRGAPPSEDGAAAALALAQAYVQAGRAADAVLPAYEAMRNLRAGIAAPEWTKDAVMYVDAPRGLPIAVPPMAVEGEDANRAAAALRTFVADGDPALMQLAQAYAALLEDAPPAGTARSPKLSEESRQGLALLTALRESASANPTARAAARKTLQSMRHSIGGWCEPWIRFAIGASLALEAEPLSRERGTVLLLSVGAVDAAGQPSLAGAAQRRADELLKQIKASGAPAAPPPRGATVRPEDAVSRDMADAVSTKLEALGLLDLLTTHLETQLEVALTDEDRATIVARLSLLLAGQLEHEPDAARRDALLARSIRVVDRFDAGSEPLRLVLLRSQHRAAQRVTEDRRAGRSTDEASAAAATQFKQLARSFDALSKRADLARQKTETEISNAAGLHAELLAERSTQQEQVARSSQFFQAWALYYQAWLLRELNQEGWREVALDSMTAFARLIEPGKAAIDPADVSVDLRSNEGFASAVLGSALVSSLVQTGSTADSWLALLEAPGTHDSVRLKLPAWRMASLLDRAEYDRALELLIAEGDGAQGAPMALIAAARAARDSSALGSAELLTEAVARIASAGRLSDLAAMTGMAQAVRGSAGAGLFEGVRLSAQAQRQQQSGDAAGARQSWAEAATALESAVADGAPSAIAAGAHALQGWALRGAGRPVDAADAFITSAKGITGDRAADTLWSAVLCLDEASRKGDGTAAARADALVDDIVRQYPNSAAAVRGHAWRVVHAATPASTDIDALLLSAVPPELVPAARKAALEGLYRRFRTLQGPERLAAARQALSVGDVEPVGPGDDGTAELRRRVELAVAADDRSRAADALAAVEARAERSETLARTLADEIAARRAQVAALDHRGADAIVAVRGLEPSSPWGRVGWRAARDAVGRDAGASPAQRAMVARAVVMGAAEGAPISVGDVVAWSAAEADLLRAPSADKSETGDPSGAAQTLAKARQRLPREADLAIADSELRWAMGDRAGAAEVLRLLLSQVTAGSPIWFSAKAMQIQATASEDPAKARVLLEQVRQLAGGFGEGETATQLHALDKRLPGSTP